MISSNPKILIVEDESVVAIDLNERLLRLGYISVRIAKSGEDAVRQVAQERPDLLLLDITLSQGELDGIQTALLINSEEEIPIIYLTAYANESVWTRTKETKPYAYILKPFQSNELKIAIEMALHQGAFQRKKRRERKILTWILEDSYSASETVGEGKWD